MSIEVLRPGAALRVIDLVEQAGHDVTPWGVTQQGTPVANPAANPAYCYEWCFVQTGKPVVLCCWFEHLLVEDGRVLQRRNVRDLRRRVENAPHLAPAARSAAVKRAMRVDSATQAAFRDRRKVRVIVLDGDRRDLDDVARSDPSHVQRRLLDPSQWTVTSYDWTTGAAVIVRDEPLEGP